MKNFPTELIAKAKTAESAEKLFEIAKENGVELTFSVLDQGFDPQSDQGKPHDGIDPHGVVLLCDAVRHQRIHDGKCDNTDAVDSLFCLVQINCHCDSTHAGFDHEHEEQGFTHSVFGE